jgi:hypothetical protein
VSTGRITRSHPLRLSLVAPPFLLALVAFALVIAGRTAEAEGESHGERPIDAVSSIVQGIAYFTDCDDGAITTDCGGAPGHWFSEAIPVQLCTHQAGRPATLTAQDFRTYVEDATEMWNTMQAAVGFEYTGDCASGVRWEDDNGVNEIGFDDARNVVSGSAAAISRGSWFDIPFFGIPSDRRFVEFDVILDYGNVPAVCARSVIAHEFGHVLGFGHSEARTDLMYNSFDPDDLSTCPTTASAGERQLLQDLYGFNAPPALAAAQNVVAVPGATVTLLANAADPEGDPIDYAWEQTGGATVSLVDNGPEATFTAPESIASPLLFSVTARDTYRHRAQTSIAVTLDASTRLPALQPSFERFTAGSGAFEGSAALGWTPGDDASSYRFCTAIPFGGAETCTSQSLSTAAMDWPTIVGTIGDADAVRVFTTGARETSMAACNAAGCTGPGVGPSSAASAGPPGTSTTTTSPWPTMCPPSISASPSAASPTSRAPRAASRSTSAPPTTRSSAASTPADSSHRGEPASASCSPAIPVTSTT